MRERTSIKYRKCISVRPKGKKVSGTIIYNDHFTLSRIPEKAYEYIINSRSDIEWIMEQFRIKTDKTSGIVNDPNDWVEESGNERYIPDLHKSIVNVSAQTVDIVNRLPVLDINETEERKQESKGK